MRESAHFTLGISGAFALLIYYPAIASYFKAEVSFVLLSGLWAMLPDIMMVFRNANSEFLHQTWANIFWFHPLLDEHLNDTPRTAAFFIGLAILIGYIYFRIRYIGGN